MAWMMDEFRRANPTDVVNARACVTGKPLSKGGIAGRTEATARGVQFAIQSYLRDTRTQGLDGRRHLKGASVIVQGFGNVGYHAAKFLSEEDGARVNVVADRDGYVANPEGLSIEALKQHQIGTGNILGFEGARPFAGDMTGIEQRCDVLIPAATENAIHAENVERIKPHLVVEAANGPVTFEADKLLRSRGVTILPDLCVNAGGVVVSYFEWVKNLTHIPFGLMERRRRERRNQTIAAALERMTGREFPADIRDEFLERGDEIDLVRSGLEEVMRSTWARIGDLLETQPELGDYRTAAYVASIRQVADTYEAIGI
jgi:glutamate dehydrogenase (NAD(P)+)